MTTVTTQNPVRSDLAPTGAYVGDRTARPSRLWAAAGIGAALAGAGTIVTSSAVDVVYRDEFSRGSVDGVAEALSDKTGVLFAFHSVTALGAVLMVVFGAGLYRRLRTSSPDGLAPVVALVGLAGTAVVSVLGSGLDTEFMMPGTGTTSSSTTAPPRSTTTGSAPSPGSGRSWAWPASRSSPCRGRAVCRAGSASSVSCWAG